nr:MAG TPA: Guanylate kinase [Caudoviricetes sp.]
MYWNKFTREIVHKQNFVDPNMLVLLVGKSGSGKTTLEKELVNNFGFKSVKSYTTRPKRVANEESHQFVSKEEFDTLENKVAYTCFNGYEYCATKEQLDNATIYVIDPDGIEYLRQNYSRNFFIVYIDTDNKVCENRMHKRGDDYNVVKSRIFNDEIEFENFANVADVVINGNKGTQYVLEDFLNAYVLARLNNRINELEKEIREWKKLKQRLP